MPKNDFSMKLSYSRSFVDAPYFYRRNIDNSYLGADDLKPEYLNAIQFDVLGEIAPIHLTYDVNLFYNKFTDMIYAIPGADLEDIKYRYSGKLEIMGAEMDVHYNHKRLKADLTACYSYVLSAKDYYYKNNHIYAIPNFVTNGIISYNILNKPSHRLWVTSNIRFSTNSYVRVLNTEKYEDEKISANIIFDLGTRYQIGNHVTLQVNCENLFDKRTYMSGATMTVMPWFRPGRTFMANVKFTL
jgi:iron complex outermembrane receptor protein